MELTQQQLDTIARNLRSKHLRIELLDNDLKVIDSIEGYAIGGSISANANNDIRRSGNVELAIPTNRYADTFFDLLDGFTISIGGKIWLDKNIKIYVGIDDYTKSPVEVIWYKLGVFLIDKPDRTISADSYLISFSCIDLMAKLTGERQGQLTGTTTLIPQGIYIYGLVKQNLINQIDLPINPTYSVYNRNGTLLALASGVSPYITIFDTTTIPYTKLANPNVLPTGEVLGISFNNDGTRLAVALNRTPYIMIYDTTTTPYTKIIDPITLPTGRAIKCEYNPSGTILAVIYERSPYIMLYDARGIPYLPRQSPTTDIPAVPFCLSWNNNGSQLAVGHNRSPYITIYNSNSFPYTKLANPNVLPPDVVISMDYNNNGTRLAVGHFDSPYITIYDTTTTPYTKLPNLSFLPNGVGLDITWNNNGSQLAVVCDGRPNLIFYDTSTSTYEKLNVENIPLHTPNCLAYSPINNKIFIGLPFSDSSIYNVPNTEFIPTLLSDAMVSTLTELGGFKQYNIYPIPQKYKYLPYDIKVETGGTVYDLLKELANIPSTWQMYFDLDGVFTFEPIPSGVRDMVYDVDFTTYIEDQLSINFSNVKNQVVVYGKLASLSYMASNTTEETNVSYRDNGDNTSTLVVNYTTLNSSGLTIKGTNFGFKSPNQYNSQPINKVEIQVQGVPTIYSRSGILIQIVDFEFTQPYININQLEPNEVYFFRIYNAALTNDKFVDSTKSIIFEFMGKQQISAMLLDSNRESPYYINNGFKETSYYGGYAYGLGTNYLLTLDNIGPLVALEDKTIISFVANQSNAQNVTITVNNAEEQTLVSDIPIVQDVWNGVVRPAIIPNKIANDYTVYYVQYEQSKNWFVLKGRNPNVIVKVCTGGQYDNIYSDQLALEQAKYELFLHSNTSNAIALSIIPNYTLDVNFKIPYNEQSSALLTEIESGMFLVATNTQNEYNRFVTADDLLFNITPYQQQYYIIKQITFPLGVDNTSQKIDAIQIYDSGNLVGDDYE